MFQQFHFDAYKYFHQNLSDKKVFKKKKLCSNLIKYERRPCRNRRREEFLRKGSIFSEFNEAPIKSYRMALWVFRKLKRVQLAAERIKRTTVAVAAFVFTGSFKIQRTAVGRRPLSFFSFEAVKLRTPDAR